MKKKIMALMFLSLGALGWSGCGEVKGPISPLIDPPVQYGFDDGTTDGFAYAYSDSTAATAPAGFFAQATTSGAFQGSGSLEIQIPTAVGRDVEVSKLFPTPLDMTHKTVSLWLYWAAGLANAPSQISAQVYVKDNPGFTFGSGTSVNLVEKQWTQVTMSIDSTAASGVDTTHIGELGVQINGPSFTPFTSSGYVGMDSVAF